MEWALLFHHQVIRPQCAPRVTREPWEVPESPRVPVLITTCCLLSFLYSTRPWSLPGVIGDQGSIREPPGAKAHSVVDNLDCGKVWFFPPKPNGCGAVWFRMDVGGGQRWPPLDGQVWKVKSRVWGRKDTHPKNVWFLLFSVYSYLLLPSLFCSCVLGSMFLTSLMRKLRIPRI